MELCWSRLHDLYPFMLQLSALPAPLPSPRLRKFQWVNGCVGWGNYPFFLRTLFYAWAGCVYIAAVSGAPFVASLRGGHAGGPPHTLGWLLGDLLDPHTRLQVSFALAVAVGLAISGLLGWHVYLVLTAQTSIEWYENSAARSRLQLRGSVFHVPFDLGWRRNVEDVFGRPSAWRWSLPALRPPWGAEEGYAFPTRTHPFVRGEGRGHGASSNRLAVAAEGGDAADAGGVVLTFRPREPAVWRGPGRRGGPTAAVVGKAGSAAAASSSHSSARLLGGDGEGSGAVAADSGVR